VIFGLSNTAYAACSFDVNADPAPDRVTDLSGQGNFTCADIIGANGAAMIEVPVTFNRDGSWVLDTPVVDNNGFVTNTPDDVLLFPQGNGSRCDFSYLRSNAVEGSGLDIGGNIDVGDSIACTDGLVNVEEAPPLPEPDIVTTTDACTVTLDAFLPSGGTVDEGDFAYFTGSNLDGTIQAVCSADGTAQNECVRGCPEFVDVEALQDAGQCLSNDNGTIPLVDPVTGVRCTPCLTAAQAEATIPGFDTGDDSLGNPIRLCWEYSNSVNSIQSGFYRPHKSVRSQTTETDLFNACYQTTTTVNFFGREITKTITTCD
jgi:hypothetical protein